MTTPVRYAWMAWQASWVFTIRSAQLWAAPTMAGSELTRMAEEKQRAFTDGVFAASRAVLRGTRPDLVAHAALAPARRRVAANLRQLTRG